MLKLFQLACVCAALFLPHAGGGHVTGSAGIARPGAVTVPETLRPAPNLRAAFAGTPEYATGTRGFSSTPADKLLAPMDGRSAESPLLSAVAGHAGLS